MSDFGSRKLPIIERFSKIPLDVDRICRVNDTRVYVKELLGGRSYCERDMSSCDKWEDPFLKFNEYIKSDHRKLCLIIGCSGVGKSSFIKYQKSKNRYLYRFNLNKHNDSNFSVLDINVYIMDMIIELFKSKHDEDTPVSLYEAFNKLSGFTLHYSVKDEYEKWKNGISYNKKEVIEHIEKCKEIVKSNNIAIFRFNKILIKLAKQSGVITGDDVLIFAVDNIDRRSDISYEKKLFEDGLIDLAEHYTPIKNVKVIISLRRVTFKRHLEGRKRLKKMECFKLFIHPPTPIYFIATKFLTPELFNITNKDILVSAINKKIIGRGKELFILFIYICLLLKRKEKQTIEGSLLVGVANESAREVARMLINIFPYDYSYVEEFNTSRISNILHTADSIFSKVSNNVAFLELLASLQGQKEVSAKIIINFVNEIQKQINSHFNQKALTDYHLFSMLIRFGHYKFNPNLEGTLEDIQMKSLELDCNIDDFDDSNQHHLYFPMPFINLFDARNGKGPINNLIRYIFIKIFSKKRMNAIKLFSTMEKLSIPHEIIKSTFSIFKYKYYIIDKNYEYVGDENIPIKLTRRGEVLFDLSTWPRYLNVVMHQTNFGDEKNEISNTDHDLSNIVSFIAKIREQEIIFYSELNDKGKETYNTLFKFGKKADHPVASMLSPIYFSNLLAEMKSMFFSINNQSTYSDFEVLEKQLYELTCKKFGYSKEMIRSIKPQKHKL